MVDYERARRFMVDNQLRTSHVTDRRILAEMGRLPRELFVPESRRSLAYIDDVQPLGAAGSARFMPAPATFAKLLQLADIATADRVLDLGAGTGYSSAVIAGLCQAVTGIEEDAALVAAATQNLANLGLRNATVIPGTAEAVSGQRYDVIMLEGAVDTVPEALFDLLAEGGRLVALVREGSVAIAHVFVKTGGKVAARAEFNATLPSLYAGPRPVEFVF
ncbi:Protein-L-isoaspartate O-methyltransferase [Devosia sp. LC5]|uniref:protein-L-isoaspartate O-methyltransferase family protein n=1 Tax=Devosia sp. LC5 TaxID=1502724 RepID=UPI0004E2D1E7|nr:protein-L-isoaspartate O-methyltransferase [Devosia sp. LC5]KFC69971.1 Protein-L-isoaspartate O-methyltransferase [Devosia sp. LC5]